MKLEYQSPTGAAYQSPRLFISDIGHYRTYTWGVRLDSIKHSTWGITFHL